MKRRRIDEEEEKERRSRSAVGQRLDGKGEKEDETKKRGRKGGEVKWRQEGKRHLNKNSREERSKLLRREKERESAHFCVSKQFHLHDCVSINRNDRLVLSRDVALSVKYNHSHLFHLISPHINTQRSAGEILSVGLVPAVTHSVALRSKVEYLDYFFGCNESPNAPSPHLEYSVIWCLLFLNHFFLSFFLP